MPRKQPLTIAYVGYRQVVNADTLDIEDPRSEPTHTYCNLCYELTAIDRMSYSSGKMQAHCKACSSKRTCAYVKKNPGYANAQNTKRYAAKMNRTPAWADMGKIREFYDEAQRLTQETGIKHSVDHIIPMRGKHISGLHVENNLQVIPLLDNIVKNNNFMDEECPQEPTK